MAAVTMIMMIPFPTTTTTHSIAPVPLSSSSTSSSSSDFNTSIIGSRTSRRMKRIDRFLLRNAPTDNNPVILTKLSEDDESPSPSGDSYSLDSASDVVRRFYDKINSRDLSSVGDLIADHCVYEDLGFPKTFVGRKAILEFFEKFIYSISQDLEFAIEDISGEDTSAVGVTWHLEWKGKPFPFSKGCSFYRLEVVDGQRKIIYGRDAVEQAAKPGDLALVAIRGVTWLLQQFPQLAERL